ncbi:AMP-binding protein [Sphingomonas sp. MAH-20]|uniref:3-methylmercaptopropionyl-CoA ligase n=1 Tax=Sphingomonas horti TaxID=2682842 RepID=A0A6I4IY46_9SPHN|nr:MULTISPECIES: AMP-binding protein [Sphingomonas]MBA2918053.1 AMP-binding protein [Sphingomonas sp. CGMCC 1.13658]MVO77024.1 AMP-binding protein [Sphingomonas horti]
MLLTDIIRAGAARYGPEVAVRFGDEALSFAAVDALSTGMALRLGRDLSAGAMLGILASNGLMSLPLDFACAKARVVRVPLNARLSLTEHETMLRRAGVGLLVYSPDQRERAEVLAGLVPGLGLLALDELATGADVEGGPLPEPAADDPVLAVFTSGTTGRLKAVVHSQASYGAVALNILGNLVDPRRGDAMLHAASLFHASGTLLLPYWLRGGAAAVLPGFEPAAYMDAVERWRPTAVMLVPTMLGMLLDHPGFDPARFSSVDTILYGASPMPRPLIERALAALGPRFVQFYGQTEAPLAIAALSKEDHRDSCRLGACGRPARDVEVRVEAPPGEPGEVLLRAPFRMVGYHDEPALTAETITSDGWLRTRDIGRIDEDGYLTLVDRTSDMIVTGGYNVYPKEVEDTLLAHPAVREAVVVGVPDAKWGEAVLAFVVLRSGASAQADALRSHCQERLARYKTPKEIRFLDAVPVSAVGKPLRRALRDPFWTGRDRRVG